MTTHSRGALMASLALALGPLAAACSAPNAAFCDQDNPCPDPAEVCLDTHVCALPEAPDAGDDGGTSSCSASSPCTDPAFPVCNPDTATCEAADITTPRIVQLETQVFDERADEITFPDVANLTGRPSHKHKTSAAFPLAVLKAGADCPVVHKHAYLLATDPEGTEAPENPLHFAFAASDPEGIDLASVAYRVRHPVTRFESDWLSGVGELRAEATADGFEIELDLHRDVVPELGERDGRFEIDLRASDTTGRKAVASACAVLYRLPAPLATTEASVAPDTDPAALRSLNLLGDGPVSHLINGTRGFVVARVELQNFTREEIFAKVTQIAELHSCYRSLHEGPALVKRGQSANFSCPRFEIDPHDRCWRGGPAAPPVFLERKPCSTPAIVELKITDAVTREPVDPCPDCPPGVVRLPPRDAGPRRYLAEIVVQRAEGLEPVAATQPVEEYGLSYLGGSMILTGIPGHADDYCTRVEDVDNEPGAPPVYMCKEVTKYHTYRAITSAGLRFSRIGVTVARSFTSTGALQPAVTRTTASEWRSTESEMPPAP